MPQQRRKVAFSGKKKKDQMLQKRNTKGPPKYLRSAQESYEDSDVPETTRKLMEQPFARGGNRNKNVNRYNLQFYQEGKKELEQLKLEGFKPLQSLSPTEREIDERYFAGCDFPLRPAWSLSSTKEQLDRCENRYFKDYVDGLQKKQRSGDTKELSLFELNLETWRQLWRVLEFSDILLIIVDVRYATLMFPPSLYDYIINTLKKHAIVVFNKVDLVEPQVVVAWRAYFQERYPQLPIVMFASFLPRSRKGCQRGPQAHKRSMEGVYNIYRECQRYVQSEVDLSAWEQKIREDMRSDQLDILEDVAAAVEGELKISSSIDTTPHEHVKYHSGVLTIGCIGFPNVGKSSLINALKGRKVVSVSRTPGHTKHFQTIFLTPLVRLCDCPGLVFPSTTPKCLQVLLGSFPISQLSVPYRSLKFLGEHVNLPELLRLQLPEDYDEWSAVAISDAWAYKRGFLTAKAARPDRYRAANHILRMCLAGQQQLVLQFYPPGYEARREHWLQHPDVPEVKKYQQVELQDEPESETNGDTSSVCSDTADSEDEDEDSSNDETNADEDSCAIEEDEAPRSRNVFALLEDE
ncbi:GL18517 [Drosophila persimilis]|uniref:Guanine nucleotide-binding protein-like 1 n=2 Tax=pseudoobscura subgroup TaxID=32358 RepID=Q29LX0_DROPS|nr:guanine nucleotide-binding protein-like 1 [Drosophila pseudoobscura]XP_002015240.1 guanine nucleotide-binding protein-like 1 [Drosophila persimilis]EDW29236.1 GL18517 [Drosophila persimilis]